LVGAPTYVIQKSPTALTTNDVECVPDPGRGLHKRTTHDRGVMTYNWGRRKQPWLARISITERGGRKEKELGGREIDRIGRVLGRARPLERLGEVWTIPIGKVPWSKKGRIGGVCISPALKFNTNRNDRGEK